MKTLLKLLLPTLIPYLIFARYTALDESHKQISEQLTEISLTSLMFYFRYSSPYLYIILFLTQYVVILPIWNSISGGPLRATAFTLLWVLIPSLLLSAGVSYVIWDRTLGADSLYDSVKTLFVVQTLYWVVNILILFTIDLIYLKTNKPQEQT
ncbi:hypothetical protein [Mucilaginibacter auburnensis]|uniref:Uncharacterized protein n=1 Tax=Mucilaginibacter auburnensis TaxID=1457233 RepID=A0A2H9VTV0_9SPHI|nr:hypothetical protein [Mucilaginibacter auburnensis]PJJ84228.1 hypothetical protein CLV57_1238 [Mucilaginibacter auburnensis]